MLFNGGIDMKTKTFIENTYEKMKTERIVTSSEQFSTHYLGKSKSYYRAIKAQGLEANNAMLITLVNNLNIHRVMFENKCSSEMSSRYEKWKVIENEVSNELALRATDRGLINNFALAGVLSTLKQLVADRATITV
jgi:hypothetical protein